MKSHRAGTPNSTSIAPTRSEQRRSAMTCARPRALVPVSAWGEAPEVAGATSSSTPFVRRRATMPMASTTSRWTIPDRLTRPPRRHLLRLPLRHQHSSQLQHPLWLQLRHQHSSQLWLPLRHQHSNQLKHQQLLPLLDLPRNQTPATTATRATAGAAPPGSMFTETK